MTRPQLVELTKSTRNTVALYMQENQLRKFKKQERDKPQYDHPRPPHHPRPWDVGLNLVTMLTTSKENASRPKYYETMPL